MYSVSSGALREWQRPHVSISDRERLTGSRRARPVSGLINQAASLARGTLQRLDDECGLNDVRAVHLNDSVGEIGSRKDRHAHIGEGNCSLDCFREVLLTKELRQVPMVLETEKGLNPDGRPWDEVNLHRLGSLVQPGQSSRKRGQPA